MGWSWGVWALLPLHALSFYPLLRSSEELQDAAHDVSVQASEQLLPGGSQGDATADVHQSGAGGLGSCQLLPDLCQVKERCGQASAPGAPQAPHQLLLQLNTCQQLPKPLLELGAVPTPHMGSHRRWGGGSSQHTAGALSAAWRAW